MPLSCPPPSKPQRLFSRAGIELYWADSLTALPLLDFTADLIVTDPPYGVNWQSGLRSQKMDKIEGDGSLEAAYAVLEAAISKLVPFRHVYAFGPLESERLRLTSPVELIWDKVNTGPGNLELPWAPQHEPIQFGVYVPSKANRERGSGRLAARLRKGSILRHARKNSRAVSLHPTEKPVPLLRELIESSSCFGELVLDPFAGSGSTLEAAYLEGRRAIGLEIELNYCEVALDRLSSLIPEGTPAPEPNR